MSLLLRRFLVEPLVEKVMKVLGDRLLVEKVVKVLGDRLLVEKVMKVVNVEKGMNFANLRFLVS